LENLAARIEALEKKLAEREARSLPPSRDWRSVVGMFTGNELQKEIDAAGRAIREAEPEEGGE
jgi:hypothetical protein